MLVSCACLNEIVGKEMKTMRPGDHEKIRRPSRTDM